jgi:S-formylglutathione hydrolase FrmB
LRDLDFVSFALGRNLIFVFPESGRRWFINDASGNRYEDYLIHDLVPAIDETFPTQRSRESRMIGGFSMGGAAAVYHSLRHPNLFAASFAYAGAFYASRREGDPYAAYRANGCLMPTENEHNRVWGPINSATRRMYDPHELIQSGVLGNVLPKIFLEAGINDYERVLAQNRKMHQALEDAGIKHVYVEHPGDHTWSFAVASAQRALLELTSNER